MARLIAMWRRRRSTDEFEALMRPYVPSMYRLARRLTGNADDAEDLVQELLLRVYPRRAQLARLDRPHPWLARVLYRLHVDRRRRSRSWLVLRGDLRGGGDKGEDDVVPAEAISEMESPESEAYRALSGRRLQAALQQLSEPHRLVVLLHDVEGMPLADVRQTLDTPVGTLKSRLHRARAHLREMLLRGTDAGVTACQEAREQDASPPGRGPTRVAGGDIRTTAQRTACNRLTDRYSAGGDDNA